MELKRSGVERGPDGVADPVGVLNALVAGVLDSCEQFSTAPACTAG
jgi:hypothetical protein